MDCDEITNVLLIVVDTLRARNLGLYGGSYDVSPAIDELGAQGTVFEHAVCTHSNSWISYTTMFRGDHVFSFPLTDAREKYVRVNKESQFKTAYRNTPRSQTAPYVLQQSGVKTSAIISGTMLSRDWGWDKGFDKYDDEVNGAVRKAALRSAPSTFAYRISRYLNRAVFPPFGLRKADTTAALACEELQKLSGTEPWFLFLHFSDPHTPLTSYDGAASNWPRYDQEIKRVDDAFRRIYDELSRLDLLDSTLIILTADHGESLGEHGAGHGHGRNVFEESIRIPLILLHPEIPIQRINEGVARLRDVGPTLVEAFGCDPPETFTGRSLLSMTRDPSNTPKTGLSIADGFLMLSAALGKDIAQNESGFVVSLRTSRYKYIVAPSYQGYEWFFDLEQDPREQNNVIGIHPKTSKLRSLCVEAIEQWEERAPRVPAGDQWTPSRETREQLRELGYLE